MIVQCWCFTENRSGDWTHTCTPQRTTINTGCTGGTCTLPRRQVGFSVSYLPGWLIEITNLICVLDLEGDLRISHYSKMTIKHPLDGIINPFICQIIKNGNYFFSVTGTVLKFDQLCLWWLVSELSVNFWLWQIIMNHRSDDAGHGEDRTVDLNLLWHQLRIKELKKHVDAPPGPAYALLLL